MNIPKAIEILETLPKTYTLSIRPNETVAIKLAIEALKWVKQYRGSLDFHESDLLPGETA